MSDREATLPFELDECCFVMLREPLDLQLQINTESGPTLPRMLGDGETLDKLLDMAVDGAACYGDEAGLALLRKCLLKYADQADVALREMAPDLGDLWVADA